MPVESKVKILEIFVAFSEYMNFSNLLVKGFKIPILNQLYT